MLTCHYELRYRVDGDEKIVARGVETPDLSVRETDDGTRRTVTLTANREIELLAYREWGHDWYSGTPSKQERFFLNGYQSWTDTAERTRSECERDVTRLPAALVRRFAFDRYGDAAFYPYDKGILHGYDLFYVRGGREGFFCSRNSDAAYLVFEVVRESGEVRLASDVEGATVPGGGEFPLCDYLYSDSVDGGMKLFDAAYPERGVRKLLGYTSWYNYYQKVNEGILLRDLSALDNRFQLFQVDDGYETFVGDWLDVDPIKFPNGLAPIVSAAHERGFLAGIWLAPFVAEEKSRLFHDKPEWFRRDENGDPIICGSNWSGFYALDVENPFVREYIAGCLAHYADLGFDFFKLDFLYASHLPHYAGKTRAQAAAGAYRFLRDSLGDKLILGCGASLFQSAGRFDYLRIGPDVSLVFDDVWYMRFMHRERISTKVTLQNTIYRSLFNRRLFGCDPDVFLLRDENLSLSRRQRTALLTVNALFGNLLMTSDNVAGYDDATQKQLGDALALFRGARVTGYERRGRRIAVRFDAGEGEKTLIYDTRKGVLL